MILVTLALLLTRPVHEEAEMTVNHEDDHEHLDPDPEGGDAREESDNQPQPAKELGNDGEQGERRRDSQLVGEETHGSAEAETTEPAQELLAAVSQKHNSEQHTKNG